jgi:membrane protease YdiL (CAAX protease family)
MIAKPQDLWPIPTAPWIIALLTVIICVPINQYAVSVGVFRSLLRGFGCEQRAVQIWGVLLQRFAGTVVLGLIPAVVRVLFLPGGWSDYGLSLANLRLSAWFTIPAWFVTLGAGIALGLLWPQQLAQYPQMDLEIWDFKMLALNGLGWAVYLAAYEFMFRGFLLFPLFRSYGAWLAILVVVGLYVYSHLPKLFMEPAGAFIFGIYIGIATLLTGSILAAYLVHMLVANGSEIIAIYVNPKMRIVWKGPKH